MKFDLPLQLLDKNSSQVFKELALRICNSASNASLIANLIYASKEISDYGKADCLDWNHVLRLVDEILFQNIEQTLDSAHQYSDVTLLKSSLVFLTALLRYGLNKQYFLSLDRINELLVHKDAEVIELCIGIIAAYNTPIWTHLYQSAESDLKDIMELPKSIVEELQILWKSLYFNSTEYGLFQGTYSDPLSIDDDLSIEVQYYNRTSHEVATPSSSTKSVTVNISSEQLKFIIAKSESWEVTKITDELCQIYSLETGHRLSLHIQIIAIRLTSDNPSQLLRLRLLTLLALSRSRTATSRLHPHLLPGSPLLKDLIAIADSSAEGLSGFSALNRYQMVSLAIDTIMGLTDTYVSSTSHKKSHRIPSFLTELGLTMVSNDRANVSSGVQDATWLGIVQYALTATTMFLDEAVDLPLTMSADAIVDTPPNASRKKILLPSDNNDEKAESEGTAVGVTVAVAPDVTVSTKTEFNFPDGFMTVITSSLNFLGLVSTLTQDSMDADSSSNAHIISALYSLISLLFSLTEKLNYGLGLSQKNSNLMFKRNKIQTEILLLTNKCIITIALCVAPSRSVSPQRNHPCMIAFRENSGLNAISKLIEALASCPLSTFRDPSDYPSILLESTLLFLQQILPATNRTVHAVAGDNGVQLLRQTSFVTIFKKAFHSTRPTLDVQICIALTDVVRTAIDIDPSFLGFFIQSDCLRYFSDALATGDGSPLTRASRSSEKNMLLLVLKLTESLSITTEGRTLSRDFPHYVIDALSHSNHILNRTTGLAPDDLTVLAKTFVSIIRDRRDLRGTLIGRLTGALTSLCAQCRTARITDIEDSNYNSIESKRLQSLQKLSNMCHLIGEMGSDTRRGASDTQKDILSEEAIDAIINAFPNTHPSAQQLFTQLSCCSRSSSDLYGYFPAAKGLTNLAKVSASNSPQVVLPLLFKAIDEGLGTLSTSKRVLRGLCKPSSNPSLDLLEGILKDPLEVSPAPGGPGGSSRRAMRSRSRGSSVGQAGSDVMISGVLDCVVDDFLYKENIEKKTSSEGILIRTHTWTFVSTILHIEWLTSMVIHCLKPMSRMPGSDPRLIMTGKDVLRRLFALFRSSLLEVSRFCSSKWIEKPMGESRSKNSLLEVFFEGDSEVKKEERGSHEYLMRVISPTGALVREDCEIDGSRVVFLAPIGTIITAQERWIASSGIVRYKCSHGWLPEFRRDHHREPIVELLDIPKKSIDVIQESSPFGSIPGNTCSRMTDTLSLREATCVAMTEAHNTLRNLASQLSRAVVAELPISPRRQLNSGANYSALSEVAPLLASSLTSTLEGFATHASDNLIEKFMPTSLILFKQPASDQSEGSSGKSTKDEKSSKSSNISLSYKSLFAIGTSNVNKGKKYRSPTITRIDREFIPSNVYTRPTLSSGIEDEEEELSTKESNSIDSATFCLYQGEFIKYVFQPIIEQQGNNLNTYLLKMFLSNGIIDTLLDSFLTSLAFLYDAIDSAQSHESHLLSNTGRCALYSIPIYIGFLRKLANRDILIRSPITEIMTKAPEELIGDEPFQIHDFLYGLHILLAKKLLPAFNMERLHIFPPDIQRDWLGLIGDMIYCLAMRLPDRVDRSLRVDRSIRPPSSGLLGSLLHRETIESSNPMSMNSPAPFTPAMSRLGVDRLASSSSEGDIEATGDAFPIARQRSMEDQFEPEETVVQNVIDMGFSRDQVLSACRTIRSNQIERVMEFLVMQPSFRLPRVNAAMMTPASSAPLSAGELAGSSMGQFLSANTFDPDLFAEGSDDADLLAALTMSLADSQTNANDVPSNRNSNEGNSISTEEHKSEEISLASSTNEAIVNQDIRGEQLFPQLNELSQMTDSDVAAEDNTTEFRSPSINLFNETISSLSNIAPNLSSNHSPLLSANTIDQVDIARPFHFGLEQSVTPKDSTEVATDKEIVELHKQQFHDLVVAYLANADEILINMSRLGVEPSLWTDRPSRPMAAQICNFIVKVCGFLTMQTGGLRPLSIAMKLFKRIHLVGDELMITNMNPGNINKISGMIHLLLALFKNTVTRSELYAFLTKSMIVEFSRGLLEYSKRISLGAVGVDKLSIFINPTFLLLQEFCVSTVSSSRPQFEESLASIELEFQSDPRKNEEKVEEELRESKSNIDDDDVLTRIEDKNDSTQQFSNNNEVIDDVQVMIEELTSKLANSAIFDESTLTLILDLVIHVLQLTINGVQVLDGQSSHALMYLLATLLSHDNISARFSEADGLELLLNLPTTSSFTDQSRVLSMITQRLFESSTLLKSCMSKEIRSILKRGGSSGLSFSDFIVSCKHLIGRNPMLFLTMTTSICTYKAVDVPMEGNTEKYKLRVLLSETSEDDEKLQEQEESNRNFADDRVLRTLSLLIEYVVSPPSPSDSQGGEASLTEAYSIARGGMWSVADVLQSLSDCVISLRSLPHMVTKFQLDLFPKLSNESFVSYLVSRFCSLEVLSTQSSPSTPIPGAVEALQAATRLLITLSGHRGYPRRVVLDAIIRCLRDCCVSYESSGGLIGLEEDSNPARLRILTRVGRIISLVVTSCKSKENVDDRQQQLLHENRQHISLDAMHHLLTNGVTDLLSACLATIPLEDASSNEAIEALLEPLEMVTRPKLLYHLEKWSPKSTQRSEDSKNRDATITIASTTEAELASIPTDETANLYDHSAENNSDAASFGLPDNASNEDRDRIDQAVEEFFQRAEALQDEEDMNDDEEEEEEDEVDDDGDDDGDDDENEFDEEEEEEDDDDDEDDIEEIEHFVPDVPMPVEETEMEDHEVNFIDHDLEDWEQLRNIVDETGADQPLAISEFDFNAGDPTMIRPSAARTSTRFIQSDGLEIIEEFLQQMNDEDNDVVGTEGLLLGLLRRSGLASSADMASLMSTRRHGGGAASQLPGLDSRSAFRLSRFNGPIGGIARQLSDGLGNFSSVTDRAQSLLPGGVDIALQVRSPPTHPLLLENVYGPGASAAAAPTEGAGMRRPSVRSNRDVESTTLGIRARLRREQRFGIRNVSTSVSDNNRTDSEQPQVLRERLWRAYGNQSTGLQSNEGNQASSDCSLPDRGGGDHDPLIIENVVSDLLGRFGQIHSSRTLASVLPVDPVSQHSLSGAITSAEIPIRDNIGTTSDLPTLSTISQELDIPNSGGEPQASNENSDGTIIAPVPSIPSSVQEAPDQETIENNQVTGSSIFSLGSSNSLEVVHSTDSDFTTSSSASLAAEFQFPVDVETHLEEINNSTNITDAQASPSTQPTSGAAWVEALNAALASASVPWSPDSSAVPDPTGDSLPSDRNQYTVEEPHQPDVAEAGLANTAGLVCPPGYDVEVFNSLPEFMQLEVIQEHQQLEPPQAQSTGGNQSSDQRQQQMMEMAMAAGMDPEALAALPESIRQEVLLQVERDHIAQTRAAETPADPSHAQDMDNASFLVSLTPELRAEVLLGSDSAFLATLPPSLQAEAQLLRERAASRWQHMEMAEEGAPGFGIPNRFENEEENRETREVASRPPVRPNGRMTLPGDDIQKPMAPIVVVAVILKLMFLSNSPVSSRLLHRLLFNLSKHPDIRDIILKTFSRVLSGERHQLVVSQDQISNSEASQWEEVTTILRNIPQLPSEIIYQTNSKVKYGNSTIERSGWPPLVVIRRLMNSLQYLTEANSSIIYDFLRNRNQEYTVDQLSIISSFGEESKESSSEVSDAENKENNSGDDLKITTLVSKSSPSNNTLLEILIKLTSQSPFVENVLELSQLVFVIDKLCGPLDNIPNDDEESDAAANAPESKNDNEANPSIQLQVPHIVLKRESLKSFCSLLLSDVCSRSLYEGVSSALRKLARVPNNREPLASVLADVVSELANQSTYRLRHLLDRLGARPPLSPSFQLKARKPDNEDSSPVSLGVLAVGDIGTRLYEKLLHALHTLQGLAERSGSKMTDITSSEDLSAMWDVSDSVLHLVDEFVGKETGGDSIRKPQSTLSAFLLRILPLIEAFFLLHASDLLNPSKKKATIATAEEKDSSETNSSIQDSGTEGKSDANLSPAATLTSIPGHVFRTSTAYHGMNISLNQEISSDTQHIGRDLTVTIPLRSRQSFRSGSGLTKLSRSMRLLQFVQHHQNLLNMIVSLRPLLLESSLSALIRVVQLRSHLAFDNKRNYFLSQIRKQNSRSSRSRRTINLQVRRDRVFEDSFHQLRMRTADELRGRLSINFYGEEGVDAGGLTREWYLVLSRDIFNPNYALFTAASDGATFQPNPLSHINNNHLDYFKFVGRVIGKAIVDGHLMDAHFTRSFYKHILGIAVDVSDMEATEPDYFKSLKQILEFPLEDLGLDLTFSADLHTFGKYEVVDLIPNGRNVPVTDENKSEYVRLIANHRMTTAIRAQIDSFLEGFHDLAPAELISIFSPTELELLICGLPDVDIEDLKANTDYHQFRESDECIVWFWDVLRGFSREERALFLQFVTGTSKVPLDGFANLQGMRGVQRFSVHRSHGDVTALPSAHTCFNQLDLPSYSTLEELREKLLMAIREGSEGFGFA